MRTWAAVLTAVALFWSAGCTSVGIDSIPQGAKVLVDGQWNGAVTPVKLPVRDLPRGTHIITVEKEGYKMVSAPPQVTILTDGKWIVMTFVPPAGPCGILPAELGGNLWKKAEDGHGQASFGKMCLPLDTSVLLKENPDAAQAEADTAPDHQILQLGSRADPFDVPFSINVRDMALGEAVSGLIAQVNAAKLDADIVKDGLFYFSDVKLTLEKDAVGRVTCKLPYTTFRAALDALLRPNCCAWSFSKEHKAGAGPWEYIYTIRVFRDVERAEGIDVALMKPELRSLLVAKETSLTVARWRNEMLADAKNQQLPALLRDSNTADLIALADKIERAFLDCAHESEVLKEQSQGAVEAGGRKDANELRELSQTLKERIELLKPILAAINEEIANRSK